MAITNRLQRVGNMDVTFDPSVSKEAKSRFLQNPVKPAAQIARFNARAQADQQTAASDSRLSEPQLLTRENSNMGWKSRLALNTQMLESARSRETNAARLAESRLTGQQNMALEAMRGDNTLANTRLSGTNQLDNTKLSNEGRLDETRLSNEGRIDQIDLSNRGRVESIEKEGEMNRLADTRRLAGDMVLHGVEGGVAQGIMNTQPGQTPDLNGIRVPQSDPGANGRYQYVAPQVGTDNRVIQGTGGVLDQRQGRLMGVEEAARETQQPQQQQLSASRLREYDKVRTSVMGMKTPQEQEAFLVSLRQTDPDLYDQMVRDIMAQSQGM